jgi:hypothetical protein
MSAHSGCCITSATAGGHGDETVETTDDGRRRRRDETIVEIRRDARRQSAIAATSPLGDAAVAHGYESTIIRVTDAVTEVGTR